MNRKVRNLLASVVLGVCLLALSFIPSFASNSANSASVGNVEEQAKIGDALVFERVGAYSVTEGIYLFLSRRMPRILFWSEKDGFTEARKATESYPINTECTEKMKK